VALWSDGEVVGDAPLESGRRHAASLLRAIDAAEHSVLLSTYIFEVTGPGAAFVDALARAKERGVELVEPSGIVRR